MIKINKVIFFDKVVMLLLVLAPIANIYGNPESSFTYFSLLSIMLSFVFILKGRLANRNINSIIFWGMGWYFIYWGFMSVLCDFSLPLGVIQVFLVYILYYGCFQKDIFIRFFKIVAIVCVVFFFVQYIGYMTTGFRISGIFSFLPLHDIGNAKAFVEMKIHTERSSSFFSEPSHFAQFLVPLLAIELFYDKNKRHLLFSLIIVIAVLLSQSGTGIVAISPIIYFFVFYYFRDKIKSKGTRILLMILTMIILSSIASYFLGSEVGEELMSRTDELSMSYEGGSRSGFLRVWRGYYVYNDYSILEKIFGNPSQQAILSHVISSKMSFGMAAELYFNAVQFILLNTGLLGMVIFILIIRHIWIGNTTCGKAILCSLIAIALVEHIYFNHVMLVHLLLAQSMKSR